MSATADDEVMLMLFSAVGFLISGRRWIGNLRLASRLQVSTSTRCALLCIPPLCVAFISAALARWADPEVRENWIYFALLSLLGAAGLGIATLCFEWLGVGLRTDALEGNNPAAAIAWSGAIVGFSAAYAGGNLGAGSSLWENVFSASLAVGALLGGWLFLDFTCRLSSSIALERDLASGVRSAGFLVAVGFISGRAVAGDWHSIAGTLKDFARDGWPVVVLIVLAGALESALRPSPRRIAPSVWTHGLCPASLYLLLSAIWVAWLGPWEGYP